MRFATFGFFLHAVLLLSAAPLAAQTESPKPVGIYFAAYRTPAHIRYSKPEVFHDIVSGVVEYLGKNNVFIVQDPVRKRIESADLIPTATLVNIARDAGASSVLLLTVDRPKTKWVKLTVEAFDLSGALLWKESVDEGGGLSGKGGVEKALSKLQMRLDPRLGRPGLDRGPGAEQTASSAPKEK